MADDVFGIVGTVQGGAFRVDQVVAEGGFAVVYRAHHSAFRASVALKCLKVPGALSERDKKEFLEKFREEAELLFRLSAAIPNIVRPLHVGTLNQPDGRFVPFLAIEWLEGSTLDHVVSDLRERGAPPLTLTRTLELLTPVAHALEKAHNFPGPDGATISVVHRDLKPENIFVAKISGQEVPKILDFGIAKVKSTATQIVGRQSSVQGLSAFTPAYGAPEQWLPKRYGQTGTWTDVWGLAITAVECLSGHCPVDGDQAAMMGSVIDPGRRPTPRNEGAPISNEVEAIFTKALAVDPKERYRDIKTFWTDLTRAAKGLPTNAAAPVRRAPAAATVRDSVDRTVPIAESPATALADVPDLVLEARKPSAAPRPPKPLSSANPGRAQREREPSRRNGAGASDVPNHLLGRTVDSFEDQIDRSHVPAPALVLDDDVAPVRTSPRARAPQPIATYVAVRPSLPPRLTDLQGPIKILLFAVALMAADFAYARYTGEVFQIGPVRTLWIAGPIALYGAVMLVAKLLREQS